MKALPLILFSLAVNVADARLPDLIPYRKGELWGYCDSTKKIILQPQWRSVSFFYGNCARVSAGQGYGLIDKTGKYVQQPVYEWIDEKPVHGLRTICTDPENTNGMVDMDGRIVVPLIHPWIQWQGAFLQAQQSDCRIGVYDSTGRVIIPFRYKSCDTDHLFSMGDSGMFVMPKRGKWGVVDTAGNVIIPFIYAHIGAAGPYWCAEDGMGDWSFYTSRGVFIGDSVSWGPDPQPEPQTDLVNGCRMFKGANGLYGFADENNREVIPAKYRLVEHFNEFGLASVAMRYRPSGLCCIFSYIDKHGTEYWED